MLAYLWLAPSSFAKGVIDAFKYTLIIDIVFYVWHVHLRRLLLKA